MDRFQQMVIPGGSELGREGVWDLFCISDLEERIVPDTNGLMTGRSWRKPSTGAGKLQYSTFTDVAFPRTEPEFFLSQLKKPLSTSNQLLLTQHTARVPNSCPQNDPDRGSDDAQGVFYSRYSRELL